MVEDTFPEKKHNVQTKKHNVKKIHSHPFVLIYNPRFYSSTSPVFRHTHLYNVQAVWLQHKESEAMAPAWDNTDRRRPRKDRYPVVLPLRLQQVPRQKRQERSSMFRHVLILILIVSCFDFLLSYPARLVTGLKVAPSFPAFGGIRAGNPRYKQSMGVTYYTTAAHQAPAAATPHDRQRLCRIGALHTLRRQTDKLLKAQGPATDCKNCCTGRQKLSSTLFSRLATHHVQVVSSEGSRGILETFGAIQAGAFYVPLSCAEDGVALLG